MGYTTDFTGQWSINKPVDADTYTLLDGLSKTRRMKRDAGKLAKRLGITKKECLKKYGGAECPLYVGDTAHLGQTQTEDVVDYNKPPKGQPSLWCQWTITKNRQFILWDEGEKFYDYIEWIQYIVDTILAPRGYIVNGKVSWQGEESADSGEIEINNNVIAVKYAVIFYCSPEEVKNLEKVVDSYLNGGLKEVIDAGLE